jgi:FkbM family methyltransferase
MPDVAEAADRPLGAAPFWVRAASSVIRRLPAGRYRAMNWVGRRQVDPFWMQLPPELGALAYACDLRDGLMREACLTGRYEPQETALLRHLLRPGMTFVDVGANWGYFTLVGAHLVGTNGRVLSVEADPRACRAVRANIERNRLGTVQLFNIAANDTAGKLWFQEYEGEARDSGNYGVAQSTSVAAEGRRLEVTARALDDVLDEAKIDRVHVMKMDIEGGEAKAIVGLCRHLSSHRIDSVSMELHPYHLRDLGTSVGAVIAAMRAYGYTPWCIDHSAATHRASASTDVDMSSLLTPLPENVDHLGDWPHVLWTLGKPF